MLVQANKKFPETPYVIILLGNGHFAFVDPYWYLNLIEYNWFLKRSLCRDYAVRTTHHDGKKIFIRMHRVIARTPPYMVCHHINSNTLDNREANLLNMSVYDHTKLHSWR